MEKASAAEWASQLINVILFLLILQMMKWYLHKILKIQNSWGKHFMMNRKMGSENQFWENSACLIQHRGEERRVGLENFEAVTEAMEARNLKVNDVFNKETGRMVTCMYYY